METSLPTPMTARVELLFFFQRVPIISKTMIRMPVFQGSILGDPRISPQNMALHGTFCGSVPDVAISHGPRDLLIAGY